MPGDELALLDALPGLGKRNIDQLARRRADMEAPPICTGFLKQITFFTTSRIRVEQLTFDDGAMLIDRMALKLHLVY